MTISIPRRTIPQITKTIVLTSGSSWTVPDDWNSANNTVHCIGGGGSGNGNDDGSGGGGGAYSGKSNLTFTPGASVSYNVGLGATTTAADGGNTWFDGTSLASCSVGAQGGSGGPENANAVGGQAVNGVGDVKFSGGTSFGNSSSLAMRGGGGAAGPNGDGGDALLGTVFVFSSGGGGGADGGGDGQPATGSAGGDGTGGDGGTNRFGVGGGSHGTAGSDGLGFNGTNGGGGGGSSAGGNDFGGDGSMEALWTDNSGGTNNGLSVGPGGGAGGGGSAGGNGGLYGGGGGAYRSGAHGQGANGVIVVQYTVDGTDTGNLFQTQNPTIGHNFVQATTVSCNNSSAPTTLTTSGITTSPNHTFVAMVITFNTSGASTDNITISDNASNIFTKQSSNISLALATYSAAVYTSAFGTANSKSGHTFTATATSSVLRFTQLFVYEVAGLTGFDNANYNGFGSTGSVATFNLTQAQNSDYMLYQIYSSNSAGSLVVDPRMILRTVRSTPPGTTLVQCDSGDLQTWDSSTVTATIQWSPNPISTFFAHGAAFTANLQPTPNQVRFVKT
jgi:hypothetical protein